MSYIAHRTLTYILFMAMISLPLQVVSAAVSNLDLSQSVLSKLECQHQAQSSTVAQTSQKSCCNQQNHQCQNCVHCPQVTNFIMFPLQPLAINFNVNNQYLMVNHTLLQGIAQNNLLRPPQSNI